MKKTAIIIVSLVLLLFPICSVNAIGENDNNIRYSEVDVDTDIDVEEIGDCNSLLGSPKVNGSPAFFLQKVFDVMKYAAIIIIVIFSSLDFLTSITSKDEEKLKKSFSKVIIRFIICIAIFVLPTILQVIFTTVDIYSSSICNIS